MRVTEPKTGLTVSPLPTKMHKQEVGTLPFEIFVDLYHLVNLCCWIVMILNANIYFWIFVFFSFRFALA
jgi:hypothetical protein